MLERSNIKANETSILWVQLEQSTHKKNGNRTESNLNERKFNISVKTNPQWKINFINFTFSSYSL
jgi:hypothetical protein